MTTLWRLLTAIVLFVVLFVFVYVGICAVVGGIAGAKIGAENANAPNLNELARQAGAIAVREHLVTIFLSSVAVSLVSSVAMSFSGIFPWCRKRPVPPAQS
jgi:hypothetical protein